jgi:hypothetical protein
MKLRSPPAAACHLLVLLLLLHGLAAGACPTDLLRK